MLTRFHIASRVGVLAGILLHVSSADAQLRVRGDALLETPSPVGLVYLRGEDRLRPWLDVESATWLGAGTETLGGTPTGEVLTLSVRVRDVKSGSELRAGRMVVSMGAVRPVHLDGARGLVRLYEGTTAEAFGGVPVTRRFGDETFDWTAGGRLGQAFADKAQIGASYVIRKHDGLVDRQEAGADFALTPVPWFTAAGRSAFDLDSRKPTDILVSVSAQKKDVRGEVFVTERSPGRLLPRTSLFSMLGDFAATTTGVTGRWRAFPRLELVGTGSVQVQGGDVGGQGLGRATLALDDGWDGTVGVEARRVDFGGARWTGGRVIATLPLRRGFRASTELELVCPDRPRGRGALWPWALGALGWRSRTGWEVATALEGAASPEYRNSLYALARLSYAFGARTVEAR